VDSGLGFFDVRVDLEGAGDLCLGVLFTTSQIVVDEISSLLEGVEFGLAVVAGVS
jgi:hypothetical protein